MKARNTIALVAALISVTLSVGTCLASGTPGSQSRANPVLARDAVNDRFLEAYLRGDMATNTWIEVQVHDWLGEPMGKAYTITDALAVVDVNSPPAVGFSPASGVYLVAWTDYRDGMDADYDIYGQLVGIDGQPLTRGGSPGIDNFPMATGPNFQGEPAIGYDDSRDRFLAVWSDYRDGSFFRVYGQFWTPGGSADGTEFSLTSDPADNRWPDIAYSSNSDSFLVVADNAHSDGSVGIKGLTMSGDGTGQVPVTVSDANVTQETPSVAWNPADDSFMVVWTDYRNTGTTGNDIYGQVIDGGGTPLYTATNTNFVVSDSTGNQNRPSLAYDPTHQRFLAVFDDDGSADFDVCGQLVAPDTAPLTTTVDVNWPLARDESETRPDVVADGEGNFLVVWQEDQVMPAGDNPATRSLLFSPEGKVLPEPESRMDSDKAHNPETGRFLNVYVAHEPGTYSMAVMGQLTDADGTPWGNEILISEYQQDFKVASPRVAFAWGDPSVYMVVWEDHRNAVDADPMAGPDIYGQLVGENGELLLPAAAGKGRGNFCVSCADYDQIAPAIAVSSSGLAFVVWEDTRMSEGDIYGQFMIPDGTPHSTTVYDNLVVSDQAGWQSEPDVAYDYNWDRFLVAFAHEVAPGDMDIHGQLFDSMGQPTNTDTSVNFIISSAPASQLAPSVVAGGGSMARYLVTWTDYRNTHANIYGQILDSEGVPQFHDESTNFPVSDANGEQTRPSAAWNSMCSEFLVAWTDTRDGVDNVYAQLVDADAALLTTTSVMNMPLVTGTDGQLMPDVSAGSYEFLVSYDFDKTSGVTPDPDIAWHFTYASCTTGPPPPSYYRHSLDTAYDPGTGNYLTVYLAEDSVDYAVHVMGQLYGPDGLPVGGETELTDESALPYSMGRPRVEYSPYGGGRFLVVWSDMRDDDGQNEQRYNVYGQLLDSAGQPVTTIGTQGLDNFPISTAMFEQTGPRITRDATNDRFLVVWTDLRDGLNSHIYGQLVQPDGALYATAAADNLPVANGLYNASDPVVAWHSGTGRFMAAWRDYRDTMTNSHIYGQLLDADGSPYGTTTTDNFPVSQVDEYRSGLTMAAAPPLTATYLVAWSGHRGADADIHGQFITAEGLPYSSTVSQNFPICTAVNDQRDPIALWDPDLGRFSVIFLTDYGSYADLAGQQLDSEGNVLPQGAGAANSLLMYDGATDYLGFQSYSAAYGSASYMVSFEDYNAPNGIRSAAYDQYLQRTDAPPELVAWWTFEEGSGDYSYDQSTYANDLYLTNMLWSGSLSGFSMAGEFPAGAYADAADSSSLDITGPITVMAWIRPYDPENDWNFRTVIGKSFETGEFSYALVTYNQEVKFGLSASGADPSGDGVGETYVMTGNVLEGDQWVHVAGVWDGSDMYVYVNGVQAAGPEPFTGPIFSGVSPLTVAEGPGLGFEGSIDEAKIFSGALSQEEIASHAGLTSMIHGSVTRFSDSSAVSGVPVEAGHQYGEFRASTTSSLAGQYTMYVLPGCYRVSATPPWDANRYAVPPKVELLALGADIGGSPVDFELDTNAHMISGTVLAEGSPAGGASVWYQSGPVEISGFTANSAGAYSITGVPDGSGRVRAEWEGSGYAGKGLLLDVSSDMSNVDFNLQPGVCLSGRIVDDQGLGVPGVWVEAENEASGAYAGAQSDSSGFYTLCGMPPGLAFLEYHSGDSAAGLFVSSEEIPVNVADDPWGTMRIRDLVIHRGAPVAGQVVDVHGDPLGFGGVVSQGYDYEVYASVCEGFYQTVLPVGDHWLMLDVFDMTGSASPQAATPVMVSVTQADVDDGISVMAPAMTVYDETNGGYVDITVTTNGWTDHGAPGAMRLLAMNSEILETPFPVEKLDTAPLINTMDVPTLNSTFNFGPLPPGPHVLVVMWESEDMQTDSGAVLGVVSGANAQPLTPYEGYDFSLAASSAPLLTGTVVTDNGFGAAGADVLVTDSNGAFAGFATTDENGYYTVYNLPAPGGTTVYSVTAAHPEYDTVPESEVAVTVLGDQDANAPDVVLIYNDQLSVRIEENMLIRTTGVNSFVVSTPYPYSTQTEYRLFIDGPQDATPILLESPFVSLTPGRAVENVFVDSSTAPFSHDTYLPDVATNTNTASAYYEWNNLPDLGSANRYVSVDMTQSTAQTALMPIAMTRTVDVTNGTSTFLQTVTLEVSLAPGFEPGWLDMGINAECLGGVACPTFTATPGTIEGGQPANEHYNDEGDTAIRTVGQPQPDQTYSFTMELSVEPQNSYGSAAYYTPGCWVAVGFPGSSLTPTVSGNRLELTGTPMGDVVLEPANSVTWDAQNSSSMGTGRIHMIAEASNPMLDGPYITGRNPAPGATGVALDSPIVVDFWRRMSGSRSHVFISDSRGNVLYDDYTGEQQGDVSWVVNGDDTTTFTFTPWEPLLPKTAYTVVIRGRAENGDRQLFNPLLDPDSCIWTFTTVPGTAESIPPVVVGTMPHDGQTGVMQQTPRLLSSRFISARFSEAIPPYNAASAVSSLEELDGFGGNVAAVVPHELNWSGSGLSFIPNTPLQAGVVYRATLDGSITDLNGNPMGAPHTWEFMTDPDPVPEVTLSSPLAGATDVDPTISMLHLYPDGELDPSTIEDYNIYLVGPDGLPNTGMFDLEYYRPGTGIRFIRKPAQSHARLSDSATYTLMVTDGLKDLYGRSVVGATAGNPLAITFTTAPTHGNVAPVQYGIYDRISPPYPWFAATQGGILFDTIFWASDSDRVDREAGMVGVDLTVGSETRAMTGNALWGDWRYETPALPPGESTTPMWYMSDYTVTDSAGHYLSYQRPVQLFDSLPVLDSPANGAFTSWPAQARWTPVTNAAAYAVRLYDAASPDKKAGTWMVPDDGRTANYTLDFPADLFGGDPVSSSWEWDVVALASVQCDFGARGMALSERGSFSLDENPPTISYQDPAPGATGVSVDGPLYVEITDAESGILTETVAINLDGMTYDWNSGLDVVDLGGGAVGATFTPTTAWAASQVLTATVYAVDFADNELVPGSSNPYTFTVRPPTTINVPGDYATIQEGMDAAASGDTVLVAPGTYNEAVVLGSQHSGVTLQGSGPAQTFLASSYYPSMSGSPMYLLTLENVTGVVIEGFTMTGASWPISLRYNVDDCVIRNNILHDNQHGIEVWSGLDNRIVNNLLYDNEVYNIALVDKDTGDGLPTTPLVMHNTIEGGQYGIGLGHADALIYYNIIANVVDGIHDWHDTATPQNDYNLLNAYSLNHRDVNPGPNSTYGDPLFQDPANGDYTLQDGSPAIDAVTASQPPLPASPATDLLGVARPQVNYPDIGAYEMTDQSGPTVNTSPAPGSFGVTPFTSITVDASDPSGIDDTSFDLWLDGTPIPLNDLVINQVDATTTIAFYDPPTPFAAGSTHAYSVNVADLEGNYMASPYQVSFTVRPNISIVVPTNSASIQGALNQAVAGDIIEILADQGPYTEDVTIPSDLSGVTIMGVPANGVTHAPVAGATANGSVFYIDGASNVTIDGLDISSGGWGVRQSYGTGTVVRNCYLHDLGQYGVEFNIDTMGWLENNVIHNCANGGFYGKDALGDGNAASFTLVHNTIVDNHNGVRTESSISDEPDVYLWYNIIANNTNNGVFGGGTNRGGWNNVWGNGNMDYSSETFLPDDISTDPLFRDELSNDYRLTGGSPCVDGVGDIQPPAPSTPPADILGTTRPQYDWPDMGAYEFVDLSGPVFTNMSPADGATVSPGTGISFVLEDNESPVDGATVELWLDGSLVSWSELDINSIVPSSVSVSYTPTTPFTAGSSHTYTAGAANVHGTWNASDPATFTVTQPRTLNVPGDSPTIQGAVNMAAPGDTIAVAADQGPYNESINIPSTLTGITITGVPANGVTHPEVIITSTVPVINIDGADNVTIDGLDISGGGYGIRQNGGSGTVVRNCIVHDIQQYGVEVNTDGVAWLENNVAFGCANGGFHVRDYTADSNPASFTLVNNTSADNVLGVLTSGSQAEVPDVYFWYNIIAGNDNYGVFGVGTEHGGWNDVWGNGILDYASETYLPNDISMDPLFRDTANNDYRLTGGSPCVDAVIESTPPAPSIPATDILGTTRPQYDWPDMGAYEFVDTQDPQVASTDPVDGATGVSPQQVLTINLVDDAGIDAQSIELYVDGVPVSKWVDSSMPTSVVVTHDPVQPYLAGSTVAYSITAEDTSGRTLQGGYHSGSFTVRASATITVPGDYSTLNTALNYVGPGDTVRLGSHLSEHAVLAETHSGITLDGAGFTLNGPGSAPVITLDGAGSVVVTGMKIMGGAAGVSMTGAHNNNVVEKCEITQVNGPGIEVQGTGSGALVENNLIHRNEAGVSVGPSVDSLDCEIVSNTMARNNTAGVEVEQATAHVYYNVIWGSNGNGLWGLTGSTVYTGYNDVFANGTGGAANFVGVVQDATDMSRDPLFVYPSGGDYSLQGASPCVDALVGQPSGMPVLPPDDYLGTVRPQGTGTDIGAFEYVPGGPVDPLGLSPDGASPLNVDGTEYDVDVQILGGEPPFTVSVDTGASAVRLDHPSPLSRTFTLSPLGDGSTSGATAVRFRITDSLGNEMLSRDFVVHRILTDPVDSLVITDPTVDNILNVRSGPMAGLDITVPANALSAPLTLTVSMVTAGWPFLGEEHGEVLFLSPTGTSFANPVGVRFPYSGPASTQDMAGFRFDPLEGRWMYTRTTGSETGAVFLDLEGFSLYTVAQPDTYARSLDGGRTQSAYRMVAWPAYGAVTDDIVSLLSSSNNLGPYNDAVWRLFGYLAGQQTSGDPDVYYREGDSTGFGADFPMAPGQGYWLIVEADRLLGVPGIGTQTDQDFYMTLPPGWSIVGNPFANNVYWPKVQTFHEGNMYGWNSSDLGNPLRGEPILTYDPTDAMAAADGYYTTTTMEPYTAYWVYNHASTDVTLRIPHWAAGYMGNRDVPIRAKTTFFARVAEKASALLAGVVWADASTNRPPGPPGSGGANSGSSPDALGAADGGGGGCFVDAVLSRGHVRRASLPAAIVLLGVVMLVTTRRRRGA